MPYMCRVGDKFSHNFVLTAVKIADGKVTTRKNGSDAFRNSKNAKCGSIPRFYIQGSAKKPKIHADAADFVKQKFALYLC